MPTKQRTGSMSNPRKWAMKGISLLLSLALIFFYVSPIPSGFATVIGDEPNGSSLTPTTSPDEQNGDRKSVV